MCRAWRHGWKPCPFTLEGSQHLDQLEPHAAAEENAIARDMASAARAIDFEKEP
jgi:hypothetical protein